MFKTFECTIVKGMPKVGFLLCDLFMLIVCVTDDGKPNVSTSVKQITAFSPFLCLTSLNCDCYFEPDPLRILFILLTDTSRYMLTFMMNEDDKAKFNFLVNSAYRKSNTPEVQHGPRSVSCSTSQNPSPQHDPIFPFSTYCVAFHRCSYCFL